MYLLFYYSFTLVYDAASECNYHLIKQGCTGPGKLANDAVIHEGGFNGFTSAAEVNYLASTIICCCPPPISHFF